MALRLQSLAKTLLVSTTTTTTTTTTTITAPTTVTVSRTVTSSSSSITAKLQSPGLAKTIFHRTCSKTAPSHVRMASSSAAATAAATSSEPAKIEWLVVIPDKPGAQAKRLEVRPHADLFMSQNRKHFEGLAKFRDSGLFKMGGAIFDDVPVGDDSSTWKFAGSTIMVVAESKQAVIDMIKGDIYVESGVWDLDKVMIWPAKIAFRYP